MFLVFFKAPPPVSLLGFPNVREKEKELKPPFHGPTCDASFFLHRDYFANLNGEYVLKWIVNHIPKFHDNPTINEFEIVVLSRQLWVFAGKEKLQFEGYFSQIQHVLIIPNGGKATNWVANLVLKFHDNPTVNESEIVIFSEIGFVVCEKKRGFWKEERGKRNWEEEETEYLQLIIYSIYLFLLFYKKELYFISYQTNKSNIFFFLQTIILIQLFLFIYLIIKTSLFSKTLLLFFN